MRYVLRLIGAICCTLVLAYAGPAEARRVALVIGNADYKIGPLQNPGNDATAVAELLEKQLKFEKVFLKRNIGYDGFRSALQEFSREAAGADVGVVYFAGHGTEVNGKNFLIPVDATLTKASALDVEAIPLDTVLSQLSGVRKLKLVILDACRNNPFAMSGAKRTVGRGLARIEPEDNTVVVYAAKDGTTADDGVGRSHSPFTEAFLKHAASPGVEINLLFRRVRDDVISATSHEPQPQQPHVYFTLGSQEFYLQPQPAVVADTKPAAQAPVAAPPTAPPSASNDALRVVRVCREVEGMANLAMLELLYSQNKGTPAGQCVAIRIEQLKLEEQAKKKTALVTPQPPAVSPPPPKSDPPAPAPRGPQQIVASPPQQQQRVIPPVPTPEPPQQQAPAVTPPSPPQAVRPLGAAEERALRPGSVFKECDECPEMVVVPAGNFMMGSPPQEPGRDNAETPQHRVTFNRPFAAGRFEVTFAEWDACVASGGCRHRPNDEGWGRGKRPVINVSWTDVTTEYLRWLNGKTGKTYRLLSEAEWEYVARAGATTRYFFGEDMNGLCTFANVPDLAAKEKQKDWVIAGCRDGYFTTAPVGSFRPNAFGLYDVHGNVWEWVQDCWNPNYSVAPIDGSPWLLRECNARVLRGGAWNSLPQLLRLANRGRNQPEFRSNFNGFRVARNLGG